jgi:hypothetical protein
MMLALAKLAKPNTTNIAKIFFITYSPSFSCYFLWKFSSPARSYRSFPAGGSINQVYFSSSTVLACRYPASITDSPHT